MKNTLFCLSSAMLLAFSLPTAAQELRIWTSRAGSTVEASASKVEGETLTLITKERKEIKLPVTDLSLADRQYLVENSNCDKKILSDGELGIPEKEAKISSKTFVKLDEKLALDGESEGMFEQMETEHFLIAYAGKVRPQVVAEIAERLWHGMAFHHMNFRLDWGDKRKVIFICEDEEAHKWLGKWAAKVMAEEFGDNRSPEQEAAINRHNATWEQASGKGIDLPSKLCEERKFHTDANVLWIRNGDDYRKVFTPFPTHCLAGSLLTQQMGGTGSVGSKGYFAIVTGHAYYKEIKLAEKTETHLIDVGGSAENEISTKSGFDDGTGWARILKSEVKRGKIVPNLAEVLATEADTLNPAKLVLMYSFANYLQSTPARVSSFATLVRRVESNNTIPEPEELASIYGFDSLKDMEKDWIEYIKSTEFK